MEHEAHTAGLAEVPAVFVEIMPHIRRRAVAVIGERLDDYSDTVGAVALVLQRLIAVGIAVAGRLFDDALDVVVGHVVGLCLGDGILQLGVGRRVGAAALLDRNRDLTAHLGKNLGLLPVCFFLLALNIVPFRMSGHGLHPHYRII